MQARVLLPLMFIEHDPQIPKWVRERSTKSDQTYMYSAYLLSQDHTFSAGSPEGQSGVDFILYFDQGIQNHWPTSVEVHLVFLHSRFVTRLVWVLEKTVVS